MTTPESIQSQHKDLCQPTHPCLQGVTLLQDRQQVPRQKVPVSPGGAFILKVPLQTAVMTKLMRTWKSHLRRVMFPVVIAAKNSGWRQGPAKEARESPQETQHNM